MGNTISSSNSVYLLSIAGVYSVPQALQGYSTDTAYDTETVTMAEVQMGVDGFMSAGFVPFFTDQVITLQADSPSIQIFEDWIEAQKASREVFPANGTISAPSISRKYALTNGILVQAMQIAGAGKVLKPRQFKITWNNVSPAPNL